MTAPVARKSARIRKVALDLTSPKTQLAKCNDIKALVKEKVGQLSKEAQDELMMLLPACDQQGDLSTALEGNPFFWSSLIEWHDLLQNGELKPPRKMLSTRDLEAIPWKDDNYERFWGERITSTTQSKAENKKPVENNKQQPEQSSSTQRKQPSKTTTKAASTKAATIKAATTKAAATKAAKKSKANDAPYVERRGRKKKVVEPATKPEEATAPAVPDGKNVDQHDASPMDATESTTDTKSVDGAQPTNDANSTDNVKSVDATTQPADDAKLVEDDKILNDNKPTEDTPSMDDTKSTIESTSATNGIEDDKSMDAIKPADDDTPTDANNDKPMDNAKSTDDDTPPDDDKQVGDNKTADDGDNKAADEEMPVHVEEKRSGDDTPNDAKPMDTEPTGIAEPTEESTTPLTDTKSADSPMPTSTSTPTPTPTSAPVPAASSSSPVLQRVTIPVHAPPSIVNKNKNKDSHIIRILPKPRPLTEHELALYNNDDFQDEPIAYTRPMNGPKRPRKTAHRKPTKTADDEGQYSDDDTSDLPTSPRKRTARNRTVSH